jgi:hypothetical protein
MSSIELDIKDKYIYINSVFHLYGTLANDYFANLIKHEIETMWNAANGEINLYNETFQVIFKIDTILYSLIAKETITQNVDYINNYIRIEEASKMHVSFVDGINSNTGYFIAKNLEQGSTAAHEFGHMLGLKHPEKLDIRGKGQPSIMYPRGTLVDANFQYDANAIAGEPGGTINPTLRIVTAKDINDLDIASKIMMNQMYIGKMSNIYHDIFIEAETKQNA